MASPYQSRPASAKSPYLSTPARGSRAKAKKPTKKRATPWGFIGNLAGDATDAVVGIGTLPVTLAREQWRDISRGKAPTRAVDEVLVKPTVESYKYTYSPLVRGDIGEFAHRVYEHPLGPLLDAATIASFGASGLARAGVAPAAVKRGTLQLRAPGGGIIEKPLARQVLRSELQVGRSALLNKLPAETRYFGESARAARQLRKGPHKVARGRELLEVPFLKTLSKVRDKHQRTAAFWLSQVPLPEDLGALTRQLDDLGTEQAAKTAAILRDERFLKSYLNPEPRLLKVLDEAAQVAEAQRAILGISDDVARQRAYMPMLLARGAKLEKIEGERAFIPPPGGMTKTVRPRTVAEAQSRYDKISAQTKTVLDDLIEQEYQSKKPDYDLTAQSTSGKTPTKAVPTDVDMPRYRGGKVNIQRAGEKAVYYEPTGNEYIGPKRTGRQLAEDEVLRRIRASDDPTAKRFVDLLDEEAELRKGLEVESAPEFLKDMYDEGYGSLGETTELRPAPGFGSVEEMIAKIDADLEAAGRPKPVYMPHTSERPKPAHVYGTGGVGPQQSPGPMRQTMGILLGRGQVIADPQVLRNSFVKSIKWSLYKDIHDLHLKHGRKLPEHEPIPEGWQVIRRRHAERTPYTIKTGSEFDEFAKQYLDKDAAFTFEGNPFVTLGDDAFQLVEQGQKYRIIVPKEFSRQLAGEFTKAGSFARMMNAYPLRIWRHLVLKLRPAWLVNNILGNTMLYLLHNADPIALQEFAGTFRRLVPRKQVSQFDELMRKHFPEQIHGTFMGSQLPVFGGFGKLAKMERVSSYVGAGLAQVDRTWEAGLRSGIVRAELRKSPELRKFAGKMRSQTDEFWKLADDELAKNPLLAEKVSDRVNDALGDYLALGRTERDIIRSAFPFYAWYRVITLITLRLPLTHPVKATLLARLGQAGATTALEEMGVPEENAINLAKGFVTFGFDEDDRARGVATQSANPLATVAQMQDFVAALASGEPGKAWEVMPGLNPFFGVPIEVATGAKPRSGYKGSNRFGIFSAAPSRFFMALPEVRLAQALLGRSYQGTPDSPTLYDRDREDELLRYLGIPYARVSPERVQEIASGN